MSTHSTVDSTTVINLLTQWQNTGPPSEGRELGLSWWQDDALHHPVFAILGGGVVVGGNSSPISSVLTAIWGFNSGAETAQKI